MTVPLQPLRIPSGWMVIYNDGLYEIDPLTEAMAIDQHLIFFKEDMLLLQHVHYQRLLDVGWYPSGNLEQGEYALYLHESTTDSEQPLHEFRTRDRLALVAEIERLLLSVVAKTI